jgi:hypothetical protein
MSDAPNDSTDRRPDLSDELEDLNAGEIVEDAIDFFDKPHKGEPVADADAPAPPG